MCERLRYQRFLTARTPSAAASPARTTTASTPYCRLRQSCTNRQRRSARRWQERPAAAVFYSWLLLGVWESASLLHPWIVRWVGVRGRAAVIDGLRAQFVVPWFVAVDLA